MSIRDVHPNIKLRLSEQFISNLAANLVFPFMIIYFSKSFGEAVAGVMLVVSVMIGIISGLYGGHFADKWGRRAVMLRAESIRLVASLLLVVASLPGIESPVLMFVMYTLHRTCSDIARPAGEAMLIDVSSPENRKQIYSLQYWAWNASLLIGGVVGGYLFESYRMQLMIGTVVASATSMVLLLFFVSETLQKQEKVIAKKEIGLLGQMVKNYRYALQNVTFRFFLLASLVDMSIEYQTKNYAAVRLSNEFGKQVLFSWGPHAYVVDGYQMFGLISAVNTAIVLLLGVFLGKVIRKFRDKQAITVGVLLYAIGFGVVAISNLPWLLLVMVAIGTIGELLFVPIKQATLAEIVPSENRGVYMAVNGLTFRCVIALASLSVTLGNFLPVWAMGGIFLTYGIISTLMYLAVLSKRTGTPASVNNKVVV